MAITYKLAKRAIKERRSDVEPWRNVVNAVIVEVDGSTSPPGRSNYRYVSEFGTNNTPAVVLDKVTTGIVGTPVLVAKSPKPPFERQIIDVSSSFIAPGDNTITPFEVPLHAPNHQMPTEATAGVDPVHIYQPALYMLKTIADNISLVVLVYELIYNKDNTRHEFIGQLVDCSPFLPAVGLVKRILIYLDTDTNSIQVVEGTAVLDNGIIPIPFPAQVSGHIPSSYVTLRNAQTAISQINDVVDSRGFLDGGVGEPYVATQIGQILYSVDGVTFEAKLPLVNGAGHIITNGDGIIVVI